MFRCDNVTNRLVLLLLAKPFTGSASKCLHLHRYVGVLKSVHLRHDNPRLFPGWALDNVEVFVADGEGGSAVSGGIPGGGRASVAGGRASVAGLPGVVAPVPEANAPDPPASSEEAVERGLADPGGRPRLYRFQVDTAAPLEAWPSADTPYIRHYATVEATKFAETASR